MGAASSVLQAPPRPGDALPVGARHSAALPPLGGAGARDRCYCLPGAYCGGGDGSSAPARGVYSWADLSLRDDEADELRSLQIAVGKQYDKTRHTPLLRQLFATLAPTDPYPGDRGPRWRSLGFQQDDPASDIRAAGLLGLKQLIAHCERFPTAFDEVGGQTFSFCVCGLTVSHALAHMHLMLAPTGERSGAVQPPYGKADAWPAVFRIQPGMHRHDLSVFADVGLGAHGRGEALLQELFDRAFAAVRKVWVDFVARRGTGGGAGGKNGMLPGVTPGQAALMVFNSEILPAGWAAAEEFLFQGCPSVSLNTKCGVGNRAQI